jgi:hypothetical protein
VAVAYLVLVRPMWRALVLALPALMLSCADPDIGMQRPDAPWHGIDYIGHTELLRSDDLRAVLQLAKQYLASKTADCIVFGVVVLTASRVQVYYRPSGDYQENQGTYLELKRLNGQWKVTHTPPPPRFMPNRERIIVTWLFGLTIRCSQPLHRVRPHFCMINTHIFRASLAVISGG